MRQASRGAAGWVVSEAMISASLSFVSAFVVARLVGPAELGAGAAMVALHVLLWVGTNALFADALVQAPSVHGRQLSSAFWAAIAVGCVAACVQIAGGWVLSISLGDARMVPMACCLAAALPVVGAGGAVQGLLTRRRRYRALAARASVGQGVGTLVGIGVALAGAGAWALVLQQVTVSALGAAALLVRAGWRPRPVWCWPSIRALLRIGLPLTASTLVQHGRYRLFAMVVAGTAGAAALGQVHLSFRLIDTVRELLASALWRLMLPVMSRRQDQIGALQLCLDRALARSGLVIFPVIGALLVSVRPVVALLLGPVWAPAGQAAIPLVILMVYVFLSFPGGVAVVARGCPRYPLIGNVMSAAATLAGVLLLRPSTPVQAAWVWLAAQLAIAPYTVLTTARVMHARPGRQWRAGLPAIGLAAAATAVAYLAPRLLGEPGSDAALLAARLGIGALVYAGGALLLMRSSLRDLAHVVLPRGMVRA